VEPNDEDDPLHCVETLEGLCVESKLAVRAKAFKGCSPGASHAWTDVGFFPVLGAAALGLARMPVANGAARTRRRRPLKLVAESAAYLRADSILLHMDGAFALRLSWYSWRCGTMTAALLKGQALSMLSTSSRYRSPRLPGPNEPKPLKGESDELMRFSVMSSSFSCSSSQGSLSGIVKHGSVNHASPEEHAAPGMAAVSWRV